MIQQEEILKGYDPVLVKRLLKYLRPYILPAILAVVSLLLATTGEMSLPVIIQRAVDDHILPHSKKLDLAGVDAELLSRLGLKDDERRQRRKIGDALFLPASRLTDLTVAEKADLISKGILSESNYLVIELDESSRPVVDRHPDLFTVGDQRVAIEESDLKTLSEEEIRAIRRRHFRGLLVLTFQFLIILLGILAASFGQIYLMTYIAQMVMKDIRTELFDHTVRLSLRFLDANPVGRLVNRVTNDVETINELFTTVITSFLKDISLMAGVLITLFLLNARLALVTLLFIPPVVFATFIYRNKARDAFRRVRSAVSRVNAFLSEHISGMGIIQMFAREKLTEEEFTEQNNEVQRADLRQIQLYATFRPFVDLLAMTTLAIVLYMGAGAYVRNLVTLGILIAFVNLIRRFFQPVGDLAEKYNIFQSAMAGSERVFDLMDQTDFVTQPEEQPVLEPTTAQSTSSQPARAQGSIVFDRVRFAYKKNEWILKELSFEVNPGETVAIVGYTGAGKTTVTSLLTRLWDIQSGRILLDGVDIKDMPTGLLRGRVQSVLQDVFIFSGTVEENIRLGSDIAFDQVQRAAKLVRANGFIESLPEGYSTVLSERGSNLSTGQRQLLSFARVVAHDPDVLVMDEATANIDSETEALIQEALGNMLEGRTSLVIAHRLSTIKRANRILVIHGGKLVEEGNHSSLLEARGLYYNLYKMQFLAEGTSQG